MVFGNGDAFGQFVWTKDARNPIFSGVVGTWNKHVLSPCVLFNPDSTRYEMWFNSSPGPQGYSFIDPWSIGFATSKDGIAWTIYPSAVLSRDPFGWDKYTIAYPTVVRENGQYKMWYFSYVDADFSDLYGIRDFARRCSLDEIHGQSSIRARNRDLGIRGSLQLQHHAGSGRIQDVVRTA